MISRNEIIDRIGGLSVDNSDNVIGNKLFRTEIRRIAIYVENEIKTALEKDIPERVKKHAEDWPKYFKEFWWPLLSKTTEFGCYLDKEKVMNEMHDLTFVADQVAEVYCHITGGTLSKPFYYAQEIKDLHDEQRNNSYYDGVQEGKKLGYIRGTNEVAQKFVNLTSGRCANCGEGDFVTFASVKALAEEIINKNTIVNDPKEGIKTKATQFCDECGKQLLPTGKCSDGGCKNAS